MRGRSRMITGLRTPTKYRAGTEHAGRSPSRQAFACDQAQSEKRNVRCSASRTKKRELRPNTSKPLVIEGIFSVGVTNGPPHPPAHSSKEKKKQQS